MSSILAKFFSAAFVALAFAQCGMAQDSIRIRLEAPGNDGLKELEDYYDSVRLQILEEVTGLVQEVQFVCELDEQQANKLVEEISVATNAAIASEQQEKVRSLGRFQTRIGFVLDEAGNVIPDKLEKRSRNYTYFTLRTQLNSSFANSDQVAEVISNSLAEEQRLKWKAAVAERVNFLRSSAVDMFISRVDIALLLDADQITRLREAILGHELSDALADDMRYAEGNRLVRKSRYGSKPETKYTALVSEIFDEAQLESWKKKFEPELARLKKPRNSQERIRKNIEIR